MSTKGLKSGRIVLLVSFFLFVMATLLSAQEYPTKPIDLVVASTTGATADTMTRLMASKVEKSFGQPFLITNNSGGGGSVAYGILAKQKADGYHLLSGFSTPLILIPHYRPVPYKLEDFVPIMQYGEPISGVVVRGDSPWKTLKEFVDYAKKNPGKVTYSIMGTGQPHHLAMEYIAKQEGGIQWTAVPSASGVNPSVSLLGGHVTACATGTEWVPYVKAGTLRLLATYTVERMKTFPDVPTFRELGYDFINEALYMLAAPKGTPSSIIEKLEEAFHKMMGDSEFIQTMNKMEIVIRYRTSEEVKTFLEEGYVRHKKMIHELKMPTAVEKK